MSDDPYQVLRGARVCFILAVICNSGVAHACQCVQIDTYVACSGGLGMQLSVCTSKPFGQQVSGRVGVARSTRDEDGFGTGRQQQAGPHVIFFGGGFATGFEWRRAALNPRWGGSAQRCCHGFRAARWEQHLGWQGARLGIATQSCCKVGHLGRSLRENR